MTNSGDNTVSVIDTSTNTVTATVPVGLSPTVVAVTADGAFVYNEVIELSHEFRPPWASDDLDEEYEIVFSLRSIDLICAAQSLENQLRRYPQRTER